MDTRLCAVQHIRSMRGGSQSHLLRASDGNYYVVKFQNNPQHIRVLANEMFATRLAEQLGLPVPQVEIIEVSDWLIENTTEMRMRVGGCSVPCSSGPQLGSLYPSASTAAIFDYLPENALQIVINLQDFARVLVLDKWTANCDGRQAIFIRDRNHEGYSATFIDHGYCFNAGEWSFVDSPMRGVYPNQRVYEGVSGWDAFEPTLSRAERTEPADLAKCAEQIPEEWCGGDSGALHLLVDSLFRRRGMIRGLIDNLRCSSRNPFPNWTGPTLDR